MYIDIMDIKVGARKRKADPEKVRELVQSIAKIGLLNPITVDEKFNLIAGERRLEAYKTLGKAKIPCTVVKFADKLMAELAEIDENLIRGELDVLERGEQFSRRKEICEELGQYGTHGGDRKSEEYQNEIISSCFSEDVADKIGKSQRTVQQEIQIANSLTDDVKKMIKNTDVADKKSDLLKMARMNSVDQMKIADKILSGEAKSVVDANRLLKKENIKEAGELEGQYRILYCDCPWDYNDNRDGKTTGAEDHYHTMTIEELCELDVGSIAEENSVLFFWVTAPLLEDAFKVINAWGFKYKAGFVWNKVKHNMGHYNSVRHEHLLIATKGSCTPDNPKLYNSVQEVERGEHSVKPEEFRGIIDTLYTWGKRIELFAREKTKANWDVWGDQCE